MGGAGSSRRRDGPRRLTARLAATRGTVVTGNLNVPGMPANRRLARAVTDAGLNEMRRLFAHKADRRYPSGKTCQGHGAVKAGPPCPDARVSAPSAVWAWIGT
ncbi:hypothetical protein ACFQVD_01370 [Streptosporangium amethystogenes subsp. fukuiense]|uniref:Transposase n=1 Tax=Streptosporangium amethystogenes subsp. fukuiense TaxID=698418 RepID=A0ABW2SR37_9ACTN